MPVARCCDYNINCPTDCECSFCTSEEYCDKCNYIPPCKQCFDFKKLFKECLLFVLYLVVFSIGCLLGILFPNLLNN